MSGATLPGLSGSLFPARFLVEVFGPRHDRPIGRDTDRRRGDFLTWWSQVESSCGPATGVRTLFDVVAMPLCARLGYRAHDAVFTRTSGRARLETPRRASVVLIVLPWSSRPSLAWRDAVRMAQSCDASWAFVLAPPFLTVVDARGHASRRSLDVVLPLAFDTRSFPVFAMLLSAQAFEPSASTPPAIDELVARAARFQDKVRQDLQLGVVEALAALTPALRMQSRQRLHPDRRSIDSPFDEALTIVYRILFLLFAESRHLVPTDDPVYANAYTVGLLCRESIAVDRAPGMWQGLAAITRLSRQGVHSDDTIVAPFNGALFARSSAPSLEARERRQPRASSSSSRDAALGAALAALGSRPGRTGREEIAYADLGVEQLGAVYERVLDLDPVQVQHPLERAWTNASARHSRRRKESATFYTPQPLAEFVVRRTLEPLVAGATTAQILSLRVVDPAMGSGAFLVAACRFLAAAYEHASIEEGRCAETDFDSTTRADIRRLIAERCLAGVDTNPVAVQLARLSLWLASLARGKPLGFLDHRLRAGNSLIGATPDDLSRVTGRAPLTALPLFEASGLEEAMQRFVRPLSNLIVRRDDTVEDVRFKEARWRDLSGAGSPLEPWRLACHVWCARWFVRGSPPSPAETRATIDAALKRRPVGLAQLERQIEAAQAHASTQRFFHWPLEFPDVFYDAEGRPKPVAGFDAVIGNPPWEMLRRDPGDAANDSTGLVRFIRESGLYPSCGRGHVNLYQPFVDRALTIARPGARVGLVLPWGLASDDGAAALRHRLLNTGGLDTVVGLDNANGIFPIHRGMRFMVITARAGEPAREVAARFGIKGNAELDGLPGRDLPDAPAFPLRMTVAQLKRIGGTAGRIPDVRHPADLMLLDRLSRDYPALGSDEGWRATFGRELNATDDKDAFSDRGLPIVEGKHVSPFRVDLTSPAAHIEVRTARTRLPHAPFERARLAYRDVSAVGNRTSLIAAVLPAGVVTTHTLYCLRNPFPVQQQYFLSGMFNSLVLNAVVRMLMGGHVTTSLVESLPVPAWTGSQEQIRIAHLARELECTSASELWAELHATAARLYGLTADELSRVLEMFPLLPAHERELVARAFDVSSRRS